MLLQAASMAACPESPVWLEMVGRGQEARRMWQFLLGAAGDSMGGLPPGREAEMEGGPASLAEPLIDSAAMAEVRGTTMGPSPQAPAWTPPHTHSLDLHCQTRSRNVHASSYPPSCLFACLPWLRTMPSFVLSAVAGS